MPVTATKVSPVVVARTSIRQHRVARVSAKALSTPGRPKEAKPEPDEEGEEREPEAVTEDAAQLGDPEPGEVFPAGPGDAPVAGEDQTLESGGAQPLRVDDDPNAGIPVEVEGAGANE